jgi:deoxyhypusine synthase
VDKDHYTQTTESLQGDYSMLMPFVVRALLENRARYATWAERMGEAALFEKHPKARGYLRPTAGYRLFEQRDRLVQRLTAEVRKNQTWLLDTLKYPLAR